MPFGVECFSEWCLMARLVPAEGSEILLEEGGGAWCKQWRARCHARAALAGVISRLFLVGSRQNPFSSHTLYRLLNY